MSEVGRLFDLAARDYDGERRALVPSFDTFYGAALGAVAGLPEGARVLDLGAGTGLLSGMLAAGRPDLRLVLVDIAPGMLALARERFAGLGVMAEISVADYARGMPEGPFDAAVSALSIHHLEDARKSIVFKAVSERLVPGGRFVNADQVLGETPGEEARLDAEWEAAARAAGASDAAVAGARERMRHDRCATLDGNLRLMSEAGLRAPRCLWREGRFAVLAADA